MQSDSYIVLVYLKKMKEKYLGLETQLHLEPYLLFWVLVVAVAVASSFHCGSESVYVA